MPVECCGILKGRKKSSICLSTQKQTSRFIKLTKRHESNCKQDGRGLNKKTNEKRRLNQEKGRNKTKIGTLKY